MSRSAGVAAMNHHGAYAAGTKVSTRTAGVPGTVVGAEVEPGDGTATGWEHETTSGDVRDRPGGRGRAFRRGADDHPGRHGCERVRLAAGPCRGVDRKPRRRVGCGVGRGPRAAAPARR